MPRATKKTKTRKKRALTDVREALEQQRQEILDMYQHDLKVGQSTSDEGAEDLVDRANSAYNREFMLSLSGSERQILLEIEDAIERLDDGSYGVCVHCEEPISAKRLQAVRWARYCIDCQEQVEQGVVFEN